jgi:hypothetical protein
MTISRIEVVKKIIIVCLVCVFTATAWGITAADDIQVNQGLSLQNWSDLAPMDGQCVTAEDLLGSGSVPVTDIHWDYSDVTDGPDNVAAGQTEDLLSQDYIQDNCNEACFDYYSYDGAQVCLYDTILPEAFMQTLGTVYWLSIVVDPGRDLFSHSGLYFGRENSNARSNNPAVQAYASSLYLSGHNLAFCMVAP